MPRRSKHGAIGDPALLTPSTSQATLTRSRNGLGSGAMVMLKLPFIVRQVSKGREYFYFRRGGTYRKVPNPTHPTFGATYKKLLAMWAGNEPEAEIPGSFGELVRDYRASPDFLNLKPKTRYEYGRHLDQMKDLWRELPIKRLTRAAVKAYQASFGDKRRTADVAIQVLRKLLSFALDLGRIAVNPALRPGRLAKSVPHKPWTDAHVKQFQEANADDEEMLTVLDLGRFTGQRRGDLCKMTQHDYDGRAVAAVQEKTGEKVWIPAHRDLKARLDSRGKRFMLLMTKTGKAFKPTRLSHLFHDAVLRANLNGLTLHGLRTTAATNLAEVGCSDSEIQAITGHTTASMVAHYRKQADKKKQAGAAIRKLERKKT
jgi:integrase